MIVAAKAEITADVAALPVAGQFPSGCLGSARRVELTVPRAVRQNRWRRVSPGVAWAPLLEALTRR